MDDAGAGAGVGVSVGTTATASGSLWRRFIDRFVPAAERRDSLWILGIAAVLGCARAVAYQPLQRLVADNVFSPRVEELGFALRATAIADVAWGVIAGVFILLVLRFTKAPKATALYIVLGGLSVALIALGGRLALNAVMALSGSQYARSLWSDLQPLMLAAAEAVGIVVAVWAAQLMSGEERPGDGGTLLPAIGWTGLPLVGAAWLAVSYAVARAIGQLAALLVAFAPQAYMTFANVRQIPTGGPTVVWPNLLAQLASVAVYTLVGYLAVRRYGAPVTVWLAFLAAGLPGVIAALEFLPSQIAVAANGNWWAALTIGVLALVALPLSMLPPLLGVWLATRPARASEASATLRENNDHW